MAKRKTRAELETELAEVKAQLASPKCVQPSAAAVADAVADAAADTTAGLERLAVEVELRQSQDRFAKIFHASPVAMVITRAADGRYLDANPAYLRLAGYELAEVVGANIQELGGLVDVGDQAELQRQVHSNALQHAYEIQVRTRSGQIMDVLLSNEMIELHGEPCILSIMYDITERRTMERELRANEARYRAAITAAKAVPYSLDYATNEYTFMGEGIEAITGYPPDVVTHTLYRSLMQESMMYDEFAGIPLLDAVELVRQGDTRKWRVDHRIRSRTGEERWMNDSSIQVYGPDGTAIGSIGILQDVTERKAAERLLEERVQARTAEIERLLSLQRAVLDNAGFAIISGDAQGAIELFNPQAEHMLGYSAGEAAGRSIFEVLGIAEQLGAQVTQFDWDTGEWYVRRKSGETLPVLLTIRTVRNLVDDVTGFVAMAVDISARKRAEQALRDSEAYARVLFEASPDAIVVAERGGVIVDVNRAFENLFGISRARVQGRMFRDFESIAPGEMQQMHERVNHLDIGQAVDGTELEVQMPDGDFRLVEVRIYPIVAGGRPLVVAINQDITPRKQAEALLRQSEQALRLANAELERAARAKDEFLASMSHELRTPLTSVLMMAETLLEQRRGPLNPYQVKAVGRIETSGRHLLELINDILDIAKIEADKLELEPEIIAVDALCRASLTLLGDAAFEKKVTLTAEPAPAGLTIMGDNRRIKQVLVNLLSNAVKFTPTGGRVTLRVRPDPVAGWIHFEVADTGIGIALEDQKRIFAPFVQVDSKLSRQYQGTGLGLSLVRKLVDMHGGQVTVTSTPGEGSCFTVSLPWQPSAEAS